MHPVLFRLSLGGFERTFYSYGAMIICGVALGIAVAVARAPRYRVARFDELAVGLLGLAGGLLGAVGLYVVIHVRELLADPSQPGMVFYGGLGGGALAAFLYCRRFRVPLAAAADAAAPGIALGHAVGRIGCLLGGCCYGRPCADSWPLAIELHGALRHPVQLYESAGLVVLAALLALGSRALQPRRGALAGAYLVGYALLRVATEHFRGDDAERGLLFGVVSTSQAVAALMILWGAWLLSRPKESVDG